jgi:hypothetical protein
MTLAAASMVSITYKECAELYSYIPETGDFITVKEVSYLHKRGMIRKPVLRQSGSSGGAKHACLTIRGKPRRASHIAFLLMQKNNLPEGWGIYFKDGNRENLKWSNLCPKPTSEGLSRV